MSADGPRRPRIGGGTGHAVARLGLWRRDAPRPYAVAIGQRSPAEIDRQRQTRREAGTQSHGPLAGSRAAEQEVDRAGPKLHARAGRRTSGPESWPGARGRASCGSELPRLRRERPSDLRPAAVSRPGTGLRFGAIQIRKGRVRLSGNRCGSMSAAQETHSTQTRTPLSTDARTHGIAPGARGVSLCSTIRI
jgi:hypothetical protein